MTVPRKLARTARVPRVLYVINMVPGRKYGSVEEQIVLIAKGFTAAGSALIPLFAVAPDRSDPKDFHNRGVDTHAVDLQTFKVASLLQLLRIIRENRIDIVQWSFFDPIRNPYLWAITALAPRVRHWFTDHISRTAPSRPSQGLSKLVRSTLLHRYDAVLCVSRFVADSLTNQQTWPTTTTALHFINVERFSPDQTARDELRRSARAEGKFVMLFAGWLIEDKGVDLALRALALLPDDVVLWVVGDGGHREALECLASELGVADRTHFFGLQTEVQKFMQAADVLLTPSRWYEAAGFVNLEAQSCGLPVVASRIGGIPEYVSDGHTGLLFVPGNHVDLVTQVRRLYDDRELLAKLAANARLAAIEKFSPEARLPDLLALYCDGGSNGRTNPA